jgi:ribonuclease HI
LQDLLLKSAQRIEESTETPHSLPPQEGNLEFFIHADGASRGNPGEAGIGAVIADTQGRTVKELKRFLGMATNNVAEYQALLLGLAEAHRLEVKKLQILSDSELMVKQLTGRYRVKSPHLIPLWREALNALKKFESWAIAHVPREENHLADEAANRAIDQKAAAS